MAQTATLQSPGAVQNQRSYDKLDYPQASQSTAASNDASAQAENAQNVSGGQSKAAAESSGQTAQADSSERDELFPNAKRAWFNYYNEHRNQVVFAGIGLAVAAGFLIIGFWPTLLLAVFITAGVLYGRYKDGDRRMAATVKGIIDRLD